MTKDNETPNTASDDPEAPDYEGLARQYLDLWQDQFAAMAADPATMETMSKMTEAWREATMSFLQGAGSASPFGKFTAPQSNKGSSDDGKRADGEPAKRTPAETGTSSSGSASGRTDGDVNVLLRRITDLETRLSELERSTGAETRKDQPKKQAKKQSRRKPAKQR
jgi:hypothetical protein